MPGDLSQRVRVPMFDVEHRRLAVFDQ